MKKFLLATAALCLLSSCANEPPKCSDSTTISLLKQIVLEKIGINAESEAKIGKELLEKIFVVENARPSSYDEKIKKYTCEGTLIAKSTGDIGDYKLPLTYESQFDDKKDHIVAVSGLLRGDLRNIDLYLAYAIQKDKEAKVSAASTSSNTQTVTAVAQPAQAEPSPVPPASTNLDNPTSKESPAAENNVEKDGICKGLDLSVTVDQASCLSLKFAVADKKINIVYKEVMAKLSDAEKASLKKEQIAWIKEKEAKCDKAGKEVEGGTLEPIVIMDCNLQMTEQRIGYLEKYK